MYFESNRTQLDGMLAVGTVVMNRLASGRHGATVCEVVGRRAQFAPGVLARPMLETQVAANAHRVADAVLAGERHPAAGGAMFFHTADVPFRHDDKRYILVSGGNAFYAWSRQDDLDAQRANLASLDNAFAAAGRDRGVGEQVVALALRSESDPARGVAVAAEITGPAPDSLVRALAYRAEPPRTDAAAAALTAVSQLKRAPRVIAPSAPVLASAGPAWSAPAPQPSRAASLMNQANAVVAQAWSVISGSGGAR